MAGTVRARWWNPVSGNFSAIGTYPNTTAAQSFTTPGDNGSGAGDWILVLDLAPSRCGSISAAGLYTAPAAPPDAIGCEVTAALQSNPALVARAVVNVQ
jgi:hypothetical protein